MADQYVLCFGGAISSSSLSSAIDVFKMTASGVEAATGHGLSLSAARSDLAAASVGDYVFAMGGYSGGSGSSSSSRVIDIFKVNSDGTFETVTHNLSLSTARYDLAAATCGNYVFAMGGRYASSFSLYNSSAVDIFRVNGDGTFETVTHDLSLSQARYDMAVTTCGNYVFAMGGYSGGYGYVRNTIDIFKVTENGVEAVTNHGLTLSVARDELCATSIGDYVLAMGGYGRQNRLNTVDVFKVDGDTLSAVTDHGLALSEARSELAAASCGNYVLAMGGYDGTNYFNTVDIFELTDSGFVQVEDHDLSLSIARSDFSSATCGNYVFAMGGQSDYSTVSNAIDVFQAT